MLVSEGSPQVSVTVVLPAVAVRPVGASGFGGGAGLASSAVWEEPARFATSTTKIYKVPFVSPPIS